MLFFLVWFILIILCLIAFNIIKQQIVKKNKIKIKKEINIIDKQKKDIINKLTEKMDFHQKNCNIIKERIEVKNINPGSLSNIKNFPKRTQRKIRQFTNAIISFDLTKIWIKELDYEKTRM